MTKKKEAKFLEIHTHTCATDRQISLDNGSQQLDAIGRTEERVDVERRLVPTPADIQQTIMKESPKEIRKFTAG
jgi:hypothetical protein